jgi:hypothetical protein
VDDTAWSQKVEKERELRMELFEIGENGPREKQRTAARKWFAHVSGMLRDCANASRSGKLTITPPAELWAVLAGFTGDLGRGIVSEVFTVVGSQGGSRRSQTEERHIAYATAYLHAVDNKAIEDEAPVKTIMKLYGVARQTVYDWKKTPIPEVVTSDFEQEGPQWLIEQVQMARELYKRAGRTGNAAAKRGKRR